MAKKVIDRGKRSKTMNEVKPPENISKNSQNLPKFHAKESPSFM